MSKRRSGAPLPGYVSCSLNDLFKEYRVKLTGRCFTDPLGNEVCFFDVNFPKLIKLQRVDAKSGNFMKAKASIVLPLLYGGQFREEDYIWDKSRAQSLLWLPEAIKTPDSINKSAHGIISGDLVYVKRYAKAGSPFKVVYTAMRPQQNQRIVTTSFWATEIERHVSLPALWENEKAAVDSGP